VIYGLKIKVDFETGERSGNIDPRDPGLKTHPTWQNVDDGWEVRVIEDDRDINIYRNVDGIEVLEGEAAIEAAIASIHKERYAIKNEQLLVESIRQKGIDITDLIPDLGHEEIAKRLYQRGAIGVVKSLPPVKVERVSKKLRELKAKGLPVNPPKI